MDNKELRSLSLCEAQNLISNKTLSPTELVNAYLDRIKDTENDINAFTEVYFESAIKEAQALDDMQAAGNMLGPLHGIPVALKDNISLAGRKTTCSSKVFANHVTKSDAAVAARLKSAGAVIVGKTNMHEFALGATTDSPLFGSTHNPWNTERFCCGSSGGSAAAVLNGSALAALGTDTGGSVRLPSSVCGLVGMRPTIGRVPIRGIIPVSYSLDACGPMTRTVRDNAAMLNVMAGHCESDPTTSSRPVCDYTAEIGKSVKNMRIGIFPDYLFLQDQPDVIAAVKNSFDIFRVLGAEIVNCKTVGKPEIMMKAWYAVCSAEAAAVHQKNMHECPQDYGSDVMNMLTAGEKITGTAYVQAQRYRRLLREEFIEAFSDIDFFLFPMIPATAAPIGKYDLIINGKKENILDLTSNYAFFAPTTGLPALTVPCGLDHEGLPIGLQLLGKPFGESSLYRAGAAFEAVFNLHSKLPAVR